MGYVLAKKLKGVSDQFEIWHAIKFCGALKNPQNNIFGPRPPSMCKYFSNTFIPQIIKKKLKPVFRVLIQLVPKSYSPPSCSLLELQLILLQILHRRYSTRIQI